MEAYRDVNGDSGISAYQIGDEGILVRFTSGATYIYTYGSAGSAHIERMKILARAGNGLNAYIIKNRVPYSKK
ncbi:hypothetical protein [Methylobacillus glycogenes]|uniref:hypothetical protein n=1 Tax=Methylobacillus glycogenes TaxID=406 RepID=UPI0009DCB8F3|nr:hypothetical protein [Methylobacillus glycogenes]